jgi:hypothetical protein
VIPCTTCCGDCDDGGCPANETPSRYDYDYRAPAPRPEPRIAPPVALPNDAGAYYAQAKAALNASVTDLSAMTNTQLREAYAVLRSLVTSTADFDKTVRDIAPEGCTPVGYVYRAQAHEERCGQCGTTGRYVTGSLNGKPITNGEPCYRCMGKGRLTMADALRNLAYDCWGRRVTL